MGVLAASFPVLVFVGLRMWNPRVVALAVLLMVAASTMLRLRRVAPAQRWTQLRGLLPMPAAIAALAGVAAWRDDPAWLLFLPVGINAVLLTEFLRSLFSVPMIERFARLQRSDLSPEEVQWCRAVTRIWCYMFVFNGSVAFALAVAAPLSWWTVYNGGIAYVLIGALLLGEVLARRVRFHQFGDGRGDRWLRRLLQRQEGA
jgi:uncharacterized membrane protein